MKKSEFAAQMASERCLPGIEDTAPLCTRQFEPDGCVECWTDFLSTLEDDEEGEV